MRRGLLRTRVIAIGATLTLGLAACTSTVAGTNVALPAAPNANLAVVGDSRDTFDQTVKNSIDDVLRFWTKEYPSISGGKPLPRLKGKLYSVDGRHIAGSALQNGCLKRERDAIIDNAFYCEADDSIAWDRNSKHLVPVLGAKYGPLLIAMVLAHEFGHAVQQRLGLFDQEAPEIVHESQADCAAGAFTAYVEHGQAPHVRATPVDLDRALVGYLNVRDDTPADEKQISHGDGFDRIGAVADGYTKGVTDCFRSDWADREFSERPFERGEDAQQQGNESLDEVLNPAPQSANGKGGGGGLQPDLDRFWAGAAKTVGKTFTSVKIAEADHPKCGRTTSEFGYCPDDNTVYYNRSFAQRAYFSMSVLNVERDSADVSVVENQPGDFALGTLFAYGWGLAVRHQLFGHGLDDAAALLAASCYTGAYAKDINIADFTTTHKFVLSPPDMDEATSAVLTLVGSDDAYGSRGTTGLDRVQAFIKGYSGPNLGVC